MVHQSELPQKLAERVAAMANPAGVLEQQLTASALRPTAVLFSDLAGSTDLVDSHSTEFSSWLLCAYLYCVSTIIEQSRGEIAAFEGDGLMGVFFGEGKEIRAVECALQIQWATDHVLQPAIDRMFPSTNYKIQQVSGIDSSLLVPVATGIWDHFDLLWVGRAANYAATLTSINDPPHSTYITEDVFQHLTPESVGRWQLVPGGFRNVQVYRSSDGVHPDQCKASGLHGDSER